MKKTIYLDYAAATPMSKEVVAAMEPYFTDHFYNPSATYLAGRRVKNDLEEARAKVAQLLGAKPGEVIFTAGATEANNLAINGIMHRFSDGELLVSSIEHESVLAPAGRYRHRQIPVKPDGLIDTQALQKLINDKTVMISVMLVNNELGTIQPIRDIAQLVKEINFSRQARKDSRPLYLHTDAAQATNYLDLKVARLGVDLMSLNGGKIYGPKQSGALYIRAGISLEPQILGGGQEYGLRSGTPNMAGIMGFTQAFYMSQNNHKAEAGRLAEIRSKFATELQKAIPSSVINGSIKHIAPHILSITFPGVDNERLMMQLDEAGIQVATGSACSASSEEPSHVLSAIGLSDSLARSTIRLSFGHTTDEKSLAAVLGNIVKLVTV